MELEEAIRSRRTHKAFAPQPVPRGELDELLALARWAPNHRLTNPWRFRVVGPLVDELRKRFPGAVGDALMFRSQPSIVVAKEALIAIGEFLKSEAGGAYTFLTDV